MLAHSVQSRALHRGAAGLSLILLSSACTTITWDVPIAAPKADTPVYDTTPDAVCAAVRDRANTNWDAQLAGGLVLGFVGAGLFGTGTAVAAQQGHTAEYVGEWSAFAAVGAIATMLGIYLIVRSSSSRQEYWTTNAAVAKIRADYLAYPFLTKDGIAALKTWIKDLDAVRDATEGSTAVASTGAGGTSSSSTPTGAGASSTSTGQPTTFDTLVAIFDSKPANSGQMSSANHVLDTLLKEATTQSDLLKSRQHVRATAEEAEGKAWLAFHTAGAWYPAVSPKTVADQAPGIRDYINIAEQLRIEAAVANAAVSPMNQLATLKDAEVTANQTAYQTAENAVMSAQAKLDALEANPASDKKAIADAQLALAVATKLATYARTNLDNSQLAAANAHANAMLIAKVAARATAVATDVMNVVQGQQLAWTDCSNALTAFGNTDAAASAAAVTALSSSLSPSSASGSKGSSTSSGK